MSYYKARNAYRSFHGRNPRKVRSKYFHDPIELIYLGKIKRIEYESDKFNGGGDGTKVIFYHDHNTNVGLYMDETRRRQLYIIGPKLKVTEAGIEN